MSHIQHSGVQPQPPYGGNPGQPPHGHPVPPMQHQPKKKPLTKRWWFWALIIVVAIIVINSLSGGNDEGNSEGASGQNSNVAAQEALPEPTVVTAGQMISDLESNALKAQNTYKDAYVQVSGNVSNIDAQGKYFSIDGGEITFTGIKVNITPEQQTQVMEFAEGQEVTITGKVTDVGEIMGYSVKADKIELN